jgi:hypothetical protein
MRRRVPGWPVSDFAKEYAVLTSGAMQCNNVFIFKALAVLFGKVGRPAASSAIPRWWIQITQVFNVLGSRDISVTIATHYGLDRLGIESRWGAKFSRTRPDRPWGPSSLLYNGYRVFSRGKTTEAWRWPPTPSNAEVKARVELYFYYPSGLLWPLLRWNLPLPYLMFVERNSANCARTGGQERRTKQGEWI